MDFKNIINLIQESIPPIHKEGVKFSLIFAGISILLYAIWIPAGLLGFIATAWCFYFFRDPVRTVPDGDNFIVSPADGLVQKIEKASAPEELGLGDEKLTRVTIFLNIFDVHINRIPISGEVTLINHQPGKFLSANLDKASDENERNSVVVKTKDGKEVIFVQIAGLVARRIVHYLQDGQEVKTGERYGLIRFGSRVDIYLPKGVYPQVVAGQRAIGGETVIADMKSRSSRKGTAI